MSDDTDERAEVGRAWKEFIEDRAHGGKLHYSMPPVRGMAPPGSFRIPKDVFAALGDGDLKTGGAVAHAMFGIEDDPEDPTVVHPHAVRVIGNGNLSAGRRVLEKFVARVRRQGAPQHIEQKLPLSGNQMTPSTDPLDDPAVWHSLIMDYVRLPMNYGSNIGGVRPLALAAGIDPHQATARVLAFYHHDASKRLQ